MQRLVIISAGRNYLPYLREWFSSLMEQSYSDFHCICIDDCSDDNSLAELKSLTNQDSRFTVVQNETRKFALYNKTAGLLKAIRLEDFDIVVSLDLDDCLLGQDALSCVDKIFKDEDVWFSYGSMQPYPKHAKLIDWEAPVRKQIWKTSALRACRWFLLKNIYKSDLTSPDGDWYKYPEDRFLCYPMVEMAGEAHVYRNEKVIYNYGAYLPYSDCLHHQPEILSIVDMLKRSEPYKLKTKKQLIAHRNDWL